MIVWNGTDHYPSDSARVVASIGNYDGVHIGHRAILEKVVDEARSKKLLSLLITFDPHPLSIVAPDRTPRLLQTREQKFEALSEIGLDGILIVQFTPEIAALTGDVFFHEILDGRVSFEAIHVGETFRFGASRSGDHNTLRELGVQRGFTVHGVSPILFDGLTVSSSTIRAAVAEGNVNLVRRLLGRPFAIHGEVVRGDGRGRTLHFPTANLDVENDLIPARGVYVTQSALDGTWLPSVTNVGVRPTFEGRQLVVETHIIDFDRDIYDSRLEVRFLDRIRDEMAFESPTELGDQIARDRAAAESYFQNLILHPSSQ